MGDWMLKFVIKVQFFVIKVVFEFVIKGDQGVCKSVFESYIGDRKLVRVGKGGVVEDIRCIG